MKTYFMTKEEFKAILDELYGYRGQKRLAKDIHKHNVTTSNWLTGKSPIGKMESAFLRLILVLHRRKLDWKRWLHEYLNEPEQKQTKDLEDFL